MYIWLRKAFLNPLLGGNLCLGSWCGFFMMQKNGSCICIHSVSLFIFLAKLSTLIFQDINEQWLLILAFFGSVCDDGIVCVCFHLWILLVWDYLSSMLSWIQLLFLGCRFFSRSLCSAALMDRNCLNLSFSWSVLFSSTKMIKSFGVYNSLGRHQWSFNVCKLSVQKLLIFRVSI